MVTTWSKGGEVPETEGMLTAIKDPLTIMHMIDRLKIVLRQLRLKDATIKAKIVLPRL